METQTQTQTQTQDLGKIQQMRKIMGGISWIKSIAILSFINSLIQIFGGGVSFIVGLGITQMIVAIIGEFQLEAIGIALSFISSFFISGIFFALWHFARKLHIWAMLGAIILYALDSLLFLLFGDFLSFGFHIYAGFFLVVALVEMVKVARAE